VTVVFFVPNSPLGVLVLAANIFIILIIVEAVVANIIAFGGKLSPYTPWVRTLRKIVNPVLDPVRKLLPPHKTGGWDLSPMLVIIGLQLLIGLIAR
jgi:YggT family protein